MFAFLRWQINTFLQSKDECNSPDSLCPSSLTAFSKRTKKSRINARWQICNVNMVDAKFPKKLWALRRVRAGWPVERLSMINYRLDFKGGWKFIIHADSAWLLGTKARKDYKDTSTSETKKYIVSRDSMTFKNPEPNENCFVCQLFLTCIAHSSIWCVISQNIVSQNTGMFL